MVDECPYKLPDGICTTYLILVNATMTEKIAVIAVALIVYIVAIIINLVVFEKHLSPSSIQRSLFVGVPFAFIAFVVVALFVGVGASNRPTTREAQLPAHAESRPTHIPEPPASPSAPPLIPTPSPPASSIGCPTAAETIAGTGYPFIKACYQEAGCDATAVICARAGKASPIGLPCTAGAATAVASSDLLLVAEAAIDRSCFRDALGWLAGARPDARPAARDRAVNLVTRECRNGTFAPDDPQLQIFAVALGTKLPCVGDLGRTTQQGEAQ